MFMALNSCPSHIVKLYWRTIYGPKSRIALLASKVINKATGTLKVDAIKIFSRISSVLGFQHLNHHGRKKFKNTNNDTYYIKGEKHDPNNSNVFSCE